jgi:exopolysaccharide biosynthesis protein
VSVETAWTALHGLRDDRLNAADSIVNGAGLLRVKGRVLTGWHEESLNTEVFVGARHPRTLIGVDRHGAIWLAAIDGRQPDQSVGMTFADLQRLCDRLELTDALNLDGGGSTTMVVKGRVVNQPVDGKEGRAVGDAILVKGR